MKKITFGILVILMVGYGKLSIVGYSLTTPYNNFEVKLGSLFHYNETGDSKESSQDSGVTIYDIVDRFRSRDLTFMLPTTLPTNFSYDVLPSISILKQSEFASVRPASLSNVPGCVELINEERREYWNIPLAEFDDFTHIWFTYRNNSNDQWFSILIRVFSCSTFTANETPMQFNSDINGRLAYTTEYEGQSEKGQYHWRQVYLMSHNDLQKAWDKNIDYIAMYEIMSNNIDMEELIEVAKGLHEY